MYDPDKFIFKKLNVDFPGSPEVKTLGFYCKGLKFNLWLGN